MYDPITNLNDLADRVGQGETEAATALRLALQPQLARILRRSLRGQAEGSPLSRSLLAKMGADLPANHQQANPDRVANRVARGLCSTMIDRLRPAVDRRALETVCD
jgi:hypothetical protein